MRRATCVTIHQSGLASPGGGRNARWREIRRSELVTVPSFSPQAAAGRRMCAPAATVSFADDVLGDDEQLEPAERLAHLARARQRDRGIGRHHPQRLDPAAGDGVEQLHRLEPFARRHPRRLPEAADAVDVLGGEAHMGGELVGEPADLAPAHGIGLAGQRERPLPAAADAAGREMAVDDGVDLVGALRRLVHALREAGDGVRDGTKELEEARDIGLAAGR